MELKDTVKGFATHGVIFSSVQGNQAVGTCPFCEKEGHFYVNMENRLWDCKRCGAKGNFQQFLEKTAEVYKGRLTEDRLKKLCTDRNLPRSCFSNWNLGYNGNSYAIPIFDPQGRVTDIRLFQIGQKVRSTAGGSLGLLGLRRLQKNPERDVYICEGEWDAFALDWLAKKIGKPATVVGVPGASVFKQEWVSLFAGRRIFLMHDNDNAGENGKKLCISRLRGTVRELYQIVWPPSLPLGFDVRDLIITDAIKNGKPRAAWTRLQALLQPVSDALQPASATKQTNIPLVSGKRPTANEIATAYRTWLHIPDDEVLRVLFGTVFANKLQGDPLWIFMIAPPGGSKSELLMSISRHPLVESTTSLTPHTLVSGANFNHGNDPSLLPKLNNRILVIKDFTTILTMHYSSRDEIFGVLRDAYDGRTEKTFGTGIKRSYVSHFGILAGVTPKIEEFGIMHQSLGERFLKYRIQTGEKTLSEADRIRRALKNINKEIQMRDELCTIANRVLETPISEKLPEIPDEIFEYIVNLAQCVAMMRGVVDRDRFTQQVMYKPAIEVGTRLAKQLAKLAMGIAIYLQKSIVDLEVYYVIRKVALDTAPDRVEEIVRQIWKYCETDKDVLRTADVSARTRLPVATCFRVLQDLELLGLVNRVGTGSKYEWCLGKKLLQLIDGGRVYVR